MHRSAYRAAPYGSSVPMRSEKAVEAESLSECLRDLVSVESYRRFIMFVKSLENVVLGGKTWVLRD